MRQLESQQLNCHKLEILSTQGYMECFPITMKGVNLAAGLFAKNVTYLD